MMSSHHSVPSQSLHNILLIVGRTNSKESLLISPKTILMLPSITHNAFLSERRETTFQSWGCCRIFSRGTNKNIKRSDLTLFTSSLHNVHLETKARFQVAAQLLGLPSNLKSTPTAALQRLNGSSRMEAVPFSTPKHVKP